MVVTRYRAGALQEAVALLPQGEAWTRSDQSLLSRLLSALSFGSALSESRAADLLEEADPRATDEMLEDWERNLGLPDACIPVPSGLGERQSLVVSRAVGTASPSPSYFIELARALGYRARIEEGTSAPFRIGLSRFGEPLGSELGIFQWTMVVKASRQTRFLIGASRTGEALVTLADRLLECLITRAAPAHTQVVFRYELDIRLPGDKDPSVGGPGDGGSGGEVEECWWSIGATVGAAYRVTTSDGELYVYDEQGSALQIELTAGQFTVLDELGQGLTISLTCSEPEFCFLRVGNPGEGSFRWLSPGGDLFVGTETGPVSLGVANHILTILDETGALMLAPLICSEFEDRYWSIFDLATGIPFNLRTLEGELYVTLETGARLPLTIVDDSLIVLDEDHQTLTIPLSTSPA